MKRKELFKRLTAVSMSAMMAVTMVPTTAFASEDDFFADSLAVTDDGEASDENVAEDFGAAQETEEDGFGSGEDFTAEVEEETEELSGFLAEEEATPTAEATVFLTISNAGTLANAKDGTLMAEKEVTVKDIDKNGILTYGEALVAAHDTYYEGGAEAGFATSEDKQFISKLWGESTVAGFWQNDTSSYSLLDEIKADDHLTAFTYKDTTGWSDSYTKFGQKGYNATVGKAVTVSVEKASYDASYNVVFTDCKDAALAVYDSNFKPLATEDYTVEGYDITFSKAGTYYLVTGGTENVNLVPAVAKVVVEEKGTEQASYLSSLQIAGFIMPREFTEIFEDGKNEFEYNLLSRVAGIVIKAVFSEQAPKDSVITIKYKNLSGVETTKNITLNATTNANGAPVIGICKPGFTEVSFSLSVGAGDNVQEYVVNMPRVVSAPNVTMTQENGTALENSENIFYLPKDAGDAVNIKIQSTGKDDLTLNGEPVTTNAITKFTPEFDADNTCEIEVKAFHDDQAITKTYIIKRITDDDYPTGKCGENLTWELKDNALTISGTGAMSDWDYSGNRPGWESFKNSIESVIMEPGVTSIGNYAFYKYSNITSIKFADTITKVGDYALGFCSKLETLELPENISEVGVHAFASCIKLENATVKALGRYAFVNCSGLKSVTIQGNVSDIPEYAFSNCSSLNGVVISDGVQKIDAFAFNSCKALTKVDLPDSIIEMSSSSFQNCSSLEELNINSSKYRNQGKVVYSSDFKNLLFCLPTIEGEVTIPEGVTSICEEAFYNCNKMTQVTIPDSVTEIGDRCFKGCTSLESASLSDNISSLGMSVFQGCSSLKSARLPKNLTVIPASMFASCSNLEEFNIPENVTEIGNSAFQQCFKIQNISLPESITTIGKEAFWGCKAMEVLTIPKSVVTMGKDVWGATTALKHIFYGGTAEQWEALTGEKPFEKVFCQATHMGDQKDAPVIAKQPENRVFKKGEDATNALRIQIESAKEENVTYSFEWYQNTKYQLEDAVPVNGTVGEDGISSVYTPSTENEGNLFYYCLVKKVDANGAATWTYSEIVTVGVAVGFFPGYGTPNEPYLISSTEDIVKLKSLVGEGKNMSGLYFQLTSDITLPDNWEPIGEKIDKTIVSIGAGKNLHAFSGIFDGNGKTVTVPVDGLPLFGYVIDAEIKNLNIYGERIAGYGLINNMEGVKLSGNAVIIDNVTLKSGSSTLKSGLVGANVTENGFAGCSAGYETTIRNSTIEKGVIVGYNKDQYMIGSFAGRMQGTVENCISHATVYGVNYVGGIIGTRDNAMGNCSVTGCQFDGTVEASGDHAGGIAGGGYTNGTAPNGIKININNCSSAGTIIGKDRVGGILGGDSFVSQAWNLYTFKGNSFDGTVKATDGTYIGGVIGYYESLDVNDDVAYNHYSENCGATKGIGWVNIVDTNCETHETESGATYTCSEKYHRTDDPLGADAEKLTTTKPLAAAYVESLELSGEYRTDFYLGEELDLTGLVVTAIYSDGTKKEVSLSDLTITGYDNTERGNQTITVEYEGAKADIAIRVLRKDSGIKVSFQLLGDTNHGENGGSHTLAEDNLTGWVPAKEYSVDTNATVYDVLQVSAKEYGFKVLERETQYGTYIYGIEYKGVKLEEFTNGNNSGWMYTLNGVHVDKGVSDQYLEDGDAIVFHYTDDYQKEDAAQKEAEEVQNTLTELPAAADVTLADKAAVEAARKAYNALSESQKAMVSAIALKKLTDAEAKIAELEKPTVHEHTFDEGKVTKEATCKEAGEKVYICTICGFEKKEELPKTENHIFDEGKVTKEASYTEAGEKVYTCTACGFQKTEVIPVIPHTHDFTWRVVSEATVFQPEKAEGTCTICGAKEERENGTALKATIKLNVKSITLQKKQTTKKIKVTMANGDSVVSWKSSNKKIVTVDKNGVIKAGNKKGTAKITVTLKSGKTATLNVKVQTAKVATKKISGLDKTVSVKKGKTLKLTPVISPITSQDKVTYTSSNKKVATVTKKGVIKGIRKGTAKITVKSGNKKFTVTVKVKNK